MIKIMARWWKDIKNYFCKQIKERWRCLYGSLLVFGSPNLSLCFRITNCYVL